MKLSQKDKDILTYIYFHGDASNAEISKATGVKEHTVRYALQKYHENNLIGFCPFINPLALGYTPYSMLFTCTTPGKEARDKLRDALVSSEQIYWVGGVGDPYHFDIILYSRTIYDLKYFFEVLTEKTKDITYRKDITALIGMHLIIPKYLNSTVNCTKTLGMVPTRKAYALDELEHRILIGLTSKDYKNNSQLARDLGIPVSTLADRLGILRKHQVFKGVYIWIDPYKAGVTPFKLLLNFEKTHGVTSRIYDFAMEHPGITYMKEGFGAFDFQLGVKVKDPRDLESLIEDVKTTFSNELKEVTVVPVYDNYKLNFYPFESYGLLESIR